MKFQALQLLACAFLAAAVLSCATVEEIGRRGKGSAHEPVLCDGPGGQRDYLNRLRGPKGEKVKYRYLRATLGPRGTVLDVFEISNPAAKYDKEQPRRYLIYMNMYHKGKRDDTPIRGYKLKELVK